MQLLDARPIAGIDRQLVHVGCLLHDIGAYDVLEAGKFVAGVKHGVIGEEILKKEGFPEVIWRFASHHTGVGLTEEDVKEQGLPIPVADYTAKTNEEQLIMYADKFHSKSNPPIEPPYFCTFEWFHNSIQKFGADKMAKLDALAELFGKPDAYRAPNPWAANYKAASLLSRLRFSRKFACSGLLSRQINL